MLENHPPDVAEQESANHVSCPLEAEPQEDQPASNLPPKSKAHEIRYLIWIKEGSRNIKYPWLRAKFGETSLSGFFGAVESYTTGTKIRHVVLTLSSSEQDFTNIKYNVGRNDEGVFEEMREEFLDGIKEGRRQGIEKFKILIQPVFEGQFPQVIEIDSDEDILL